MGMEDMHAAEWDAGCARLLEDELAQIYDRIADIRRTYP
jgi:hypothetical protein